MNDSSKQSRKQCSSKKRAATFDRRTAIKTALAATVLAGNRSASAALPVLQGKKDNGRRSRLGTMDSPLKLRAANDYRNSLSQYGGQLSSPIRELFLTATKPNKIHFGVVVIGSGYGAAITAARLSEKLKGEHRMCILERGKEWLPGTFPDNWANVTKNNRSGLVGPDTKQVTKPLGLFNVNFNDEVNILTGNGLGGGSLINANVALRPHSEVFQQSRWPRALSDIQVLGPYYDRVAKSLSLTRTPYDLTPKVRSRRLAAARLSNNPSFFDRSHLSVMYDYRHLDDEMRNPQGMIQRACTLCGDCINGCNVGAKNTLAMNYLPVARHNGTEMFTQVEVRSIEKHGGFYRINMEYVDVTENEVTRHPVSINSRLVVVGAGSPGSVKILKNSEDKHLQFSPALGNNWSINGDTIGFVIGLPPGQNIAGHGAFPANKPGVGPTVQTSLNFYRDIELRRRLLIQDAAIPRGVANLLSYLMRDPEMDKTMVMLGMGHDTASGKMVWKNGRWTISWPGLKESAYRKMVFGEFDRLARAHGGKYKRLKAFGDNLVTVHPLGGCGMSDMPTQGTTNHLGQVYDGAGGCREDQHGQGAVHENLYVADGSLMPTALGVNPYMTIGALAERVARHIVTNPNHSDLFA